MRPARLYGQTAPQADTWLARGGFNGDRPIIGEDCLIFSVWTPKPDSARRPVPATCLTWADNRAARTAYEYQVGRQACRARTDLTGLPGLRHHELHP